MKRPQIFLLLFSTLSEILKLGKLEQARGGETFFWVSLIPVLYLLLATCNWLLTCRRHSGEKVPAVPSVQKACA